MRRSTAGWLEIGGKRIYARSKWEKNYARYLQFLKENGGIDDWEHEPDTFWFDGIKRGVTSYLPDFKVFGPDRDEDGLFVVRYHEVKGYMDGKSKTKLKRMAKYHPEVEMILVDGPAYKALAKLMKPVLADWES